MIGCVYVITDKPNDGPHLWAVDFVLSTVTHSGARGEVLRLCRKDDTLLFMGGIEATREEREFLNREGIAWQSP